MAFSFGASAAPRNDEMLPPSMGGGNNMMQLFAQLLQGGGQMAQQGPDLGALLKQMKVQRDPQGFYNKMNTMPSAGGGGPWNDLGSGQPFFKPMAEAFPRVGAPPPTAAASRPAPNPTDPYKKPAAPRRGGFSFGAGGY